MVKKMKEKIKEIKAYLDEPFFVWVRTGDYFKTSFLEGVGRGFMFVWVPMMIIFGIFGYQLEFVKK